MKIHPPPSATAPAQRVTPPTAHPILDDPFIKPQVLHSYSPLIQHLSIRYISGSYALSHSCPASTAQLRCFPAGCLCHCLPPKAEGLPVGLRASVPTQSKADSGGLNEAPQTQLMSGYR